MILHVVIGHRANPIDPGELTPTLVGTVIPLIAFLALPCGLQSEIAIKRVCLVKHNNLALAH